MSVNYFHIFSLLLLFFRPKTSWSLLPLPCLNFTHPEKPCLKSTSSNESSPPTQLEVIAPRLLHRVVGCVLFCASPFTWQGLPYICEHFWSTDSVASLVQLPFNTSQHRPPLLTELRWFAKFRIWRFIEWLDKGKPRMKLRAKQQENS